MKNIKILILSAVSSLAFGQFSIKIAVSGDYKGDEAYFYTLDGSKDILLAKKDKKNNIWEVKSNQPYKGMMKLYLPFDNEQISFVSENRDVALDLVYQNNKLKEVVFKDDANKLMSQYLSKERKKEYILPALMQIEAFYQPKEKFSAALKQEISELTTPLDIDSEKYEFINFYDLNNNKFAAKESSASQEEIIHFLTNSGEMLEASSLIRPILMNYLSSKNNTNSDEAISKLLKSVNIETSRGQNILSELIDIFDTYGMESLKNKYLSDAQNLKCTINDRLSGTIKANKNTAIGAVFADIPLNNAMNTMAKNLYGIKVDKKIIVFWSSTCSHCERQLPEFIPFYQKLKEKNIQIVGLSMDSDKDSYFEKAKNYPWISASELRGWHSQYTDLYNVKATPTYYILDKNNKIEAHPNTISEIFSYLGVK